MKVKTILNSELAPVLTQYCVDFVSRFSEQYDNVLMEYAERLVKHDVTPKELQRGIERLKTRSGKNKFSPNPEEFALMCKPSAEELGIPDLDHCMHEIREARGRWRFDKYPFAHDLVRLMNDNVGYELYHCSAQQFRKLCEREYERLLVLARKDSLPKNIKALPRNAEERSVVEKSGHLLSKSDAQKTLARFGIQRNLA